MHSGFLQDPLGAAGAGLDVEAWSTDLPFSAPSMNSKCLMICSTVSAMLVVSSFQSFWIADTRAEYSDPIFISMVAWKYILVLCRVW